MNMLMRLMEWAILLVIVVAVLQCLPSPHWMWRWRIVKKGEARFQIQAIGPLKPWWHPVIIGFDNEAEGRTLEEAKEFLDRARGVKKSNDGVVWRQP